MRKWIDLLAEGQYVPPPAEYEADDAEHYDALDRTGFFGEQAAGVVFFAQDTKRLLLMLRSYAVLQPGTYGNCGGAHKSSESPAAAAEREGREETGFSGDMSLVPAYVFRKGDFTYRNFIAVIDREFKPDLGWEASAHVWCEWGDWPHPLHFGMEALLSDPQTMQKFKELIDS